MGFLLDASHYQGTINWPRVRADNCLGAYIKVSDGSTGVDPTWQTNHAGARGVGLPVGPYHFAEGGNSGTEAAHFSGAWPAGWDLDPVLDYEIAGANAGWLSSFRLNFRTITGFQPFRVYSGLSLLEGALNPANWIDAETTIWAARYAASLGWNHPALVLWQNTSTATLPGVLGDVDEDQFMNGWTPATDQGGSVALTQTDAQLVVDTLLNTLLDQWFTPAPTPSVHVADALAAQYAALNISTNDPTLFDRFTSVDSQLAAVNGAITAEQGAVLAAVAGIQAGAAPTDAQMATLTAALEAALPSYTVSIAPKTS